MDKSIRYVREHCIATLLNDMVTHIVLKKPDDPLGCLVNFLETEKSPSSHTRHAAKTVAQPQTITKPLPGTANETLDEILRNEIAVYERLAAADLSSVDAELGAQLRKARSGSSMSLALLANVATDQAVKDTLTRLLSSEE